jgi:hypothetical protein
VSSNQQEQQSVQPISYEALGQFIEQAGAELGIDVDTVITASDVVWILSDEGEKLIRWTPGGWAVETVTEDDDESAA